MEIPIFSDIRHEIKEALLASTNTIKIAVAWFTNQELFEIVINKLKERVEVELITIDDLVNNGDFGLNFFDFLNLGGKLYFTKPTSPCHHKFCIIDNTKLINGSYNWTYYAEARNKENIIISTNSNTVQLFLKEFERIKASLTPVDVWAKRSAGDEVFLVDYSSYYLQDRIIKSEQESNSEIPVFLSDNFPEYSIKEERIGITKKLANSIGVQTINKGVNTVYKILERGRSIPCTNTLTFSSHDSHFDYLDVKIFSGEGELVQDCTLLDSFRMNLKPYERLRERLKVTFRITLQGDLILNVEDLIDANNYLRETLNIASLLVTT
jgi:hypothetical protein